jgi:hypothetical protein
MARWNFNRGPLSKAFSDYERARQVWEILAKRQRDTGNQTTFPLDRGLLNNLGFTQGDLGHNLGDLQNVLTKLQEFTWHWDRRGPLSSKPGEPGPVAYIAGHTPVIGPHFAEGHAAFTACSAKHEKKQHEGT